jgi:hypothetical protein
MLVYLAFLVAAMAFGVWLALQGIRMLCESEKHR